jgi:hypothetical protein
MQIKVETNTGQTILVESGVGKQGLPGIRKWDELEEKPDTFPPSAHTHIADDIEDASSLGREIIKSQMPKSVRDLIGLNFFSVKDFGAAGDGVTDDRASLQAALLAARDAGGGTVYLPEGVYVLSTRSPSEISTYKGSVRVFPNTVLIGDGPQKSIVKVGDNAPGDFPVLFAHSDSSSEIAADIIFKDFAIDGNRWRPTSGGEDEAIDLESTRRIKFLNLHIYNMGADGIDLDNQIGGATEHYVFNCRFTNCRGLGIHGGGNNFRVYHSRFEECGRGRLDGYNPSLPRETRWVTPNTSQSAAWDGACADTRAGSGHVYDGCDFVGGGQGLKIGGGTAVRNCNFSGDFLNGVGIMIGDQIEPTPGNASPSVSVTGCSFGSLMDASISVGERNKVQRGIWVRHGRARITNCSFVQNGGAGIVIGGAIVDGSSTPQGVPNQVFVTACSFFATSTDGALGGGIRVAAGTSNATVMQNYCSSTATALLTISRSPTGQIIFAGNNKVASGMIVDVRVRADNMVIRDNCSTTFQSIRFLGTGTSPNRGRDSVGCLITGNLTSQDFDTLSLANNIVKNNIWDGVWVPDGRSNP